MGRGGGGGRGGGEGGEERRCWFKFKIIDQCSRFVKSTISSFSCDLSFFSGYVGLRIVSDA